MCAITGAVGGIGEAMVRGFAREGASVVAASLHPDDGEKLAAKAGNRSMSVELDVASEASWIKVNACSPDFIRTNVNNYQGVETAQEGAREAVRLALLGPDGPMGTLYLGKKIEAYDVKMAMLAVLIFPLMILASGRRAGVRGRAPYAGRLPLQNLA